MNYIYVCDINLYDDGNFKPVIYEAVTSLDISMELNKNEYFLATELIIKDSSVRLPKIKSKHVETIVRPMIVLMDYDFS